MKATITIIGSMIILALIVFANWQHDEAVIEQQVVIDHYRDSIQSKIDSIDAKLKDYEDELSIYNDTSRSVNDYHDLYYSLIAHRVPFAKMFTQVAVLEKGWKFEHAVYNNIFGFNVQGLRFADKKEAVVYLKRWVDMSPPIDNEDCYDYLKRRHYNPYAFYIPRLKNIRLKIMSPCEVLRK